MTLPSASPAITSSPVVRRYAIDGERSVARFAVGFRIWRVVRGSFSGLSGLILECDDPTSCGGELIIPVAALRTGNRLRDRHLRSSDYLDERRFPAIVFRAATVCLDGGRATVAGALTIRDITQPLAIELSRSRARIGSPDRDARVRLQGATLLDRAVFGVRGGGILGFADRLIATVVHCEIDVEAVRIGD